jgi:hypothetical protein
MSEPRHDKPLAVIRSVLDWLYADRGMMDQRTDFLGIRWCLVYAAIAMSPILSLVSLAFPMITASIVACCVIDAIVRYVNRCDDRRFTKRPPDLP